jgi:myo-inositol-1-phosphate synthase
MKAISNYVPALRIMQQNKTAANAPKTNQHEENCHKMDGTSRITTESIAAESILCANLCRQQWLINVHVCKKMQPEPAQGRNVLVENRQQHESCIKLCTCSKNPCSKIKRLQTLPKQTNKKKTATKWLGTCRFITDSIAA